MRPSSCCTTRPFIGVVSAVLGSIISTLDRRITIFGLADVRGAVHAGFDEGGAARRRLLGREIERDPAGRGATQGSCVCFDLKPSHETSRGRDSGLL
jgi:hypothetical protein